MKQEYSYGAVVYEKRKDSIYILIEFMLQGHISLPKGHIEEGETDLDVRLDTNFSHTITYKPTQDIKKDVTFFLATPISNHIKPQESEVNHIEWLIEKRALAVLTHETDKQVLRDALRYIHQHEEN